MTSKTLQALERKPPPATRQEIADAHLPGLYLVRQPSGAMSWAVRYRFSGKSRKATLGPYPALGLADARKAAGAALRSVEEGHDFGAEKVAEKIARRAPQPSPDRDLVRVVVDEFLRRAVQGKNRSAPLTEAIFRNHVLPTWGDRKVQSITRRDVIELTDAIVDRGEPYAANRVFAHVRRLFNWCVSRSIVEASPCTGLKPPGNETARDRVLFDDEVRLFWKATEAIGQPFGPMFRLLLLTGQRREEVASMRFAEIEGTEWTIPADRAKNGRPNVVPLSAEAIAVLASVQRIAGRPGYVFTTTGQSSVSGFSKAKARVDEAMQKLARQDDEDAELPPWRLHDLRRTAATGMARLRIQPHVIEAVLNHQSGQVSGIAAVYNRFEYRDEKAAALAAWGRFVADLVADRPAGNVVELGRR
jgi:integrase